MNTLNITSVRAKRRVAIDHACLLLVMTVALIPGCTRERLKAETSITLPGTRPAHEGLRAGVSRRDISAPELLGNVKVHDPLYARALVLDDGDKAVAIVCVDMIWPSFVEVRERIRKELGIELTLVNCTHTHADGRGGHNARWRAAVGQMVFDTVKEAYAARVPVSLYAGRAPVQLGGNRYGKDFTQDVVPWVNMLEVRTKKDGPLAVLFEHSAHPVITLESPGGLSADYPGYAIKRINEKLGNDVVPMFAQGCGGNINAEPVGCDVTSGWYENAERAGRKLGDAVLAAMRDSTEIKATKLTLRSRTVMLPLRVPSMEEWEEQVAQLKKEKPDDKAALESLQRLKEIIERGQNPRVQYGINAVMLGSEWVLVTLPGEPFTEYELFVNAHAPFSRNMTFGFTNSREEDGYEQYILTDRALALSINRPDLANSSCRDALRTIKASTHENVYLSYAVGVEAAIQQAVKSLWAE